VTDYEAVTQLAEMRSLTVFSPDRHFSLACYLLAVLATGVA